MKNNSIGSNFLILISDEHRKDAMGCVGHPVVKTANLDALAKRGTLFTNAYTPSPMCVPTRASIACGDYVHNIGHWDSASPYDGKQRSWMSHLSAQGVHTASIGKLHFRSSDDNNGFAEEILPMHVVGGVGWTIGLLRENPPDYDCASELAQDVGVGATSYTDYDRAITEATIGWLNNRHEVAEEKPWAAFVSLVSPHYPLCAPAEFYNLYHPNKIDLPVAYHHTNKPAHPELRNIRHFFNYDEHFDENKMREARVAYYGLTSFMDHCIGRILQTLDNTGMADNTVVLYVSDHGDMLGDQGYWTKQVMFDASAGVPMIAAGPGIPCGHTITGGTSLVDIAATAVDVTGCTHDEQSKSLPGVSLREIANKPDDTMRTVFSEYHDGGSTTATFMVRWGQWKYVHYVGYPEQLFDMDNDPTELHDLAQGVVEDPHILNALEEGRRRLNHICDPVAVNNQCFADQKLKIEALGGEEVCATAYTFNHTPVGS